MTKLFLITYNPTEPFNKAIFHNYIESLYTNGTISDWFHYIDESYIVATNKTANDIYNSVFPGVPKRFMLVIEANPNNAQGWIPADAWSWLKKYQTPDGK